MKMKDGKGVGPDDIPVEAWRSLGDMTVRFLTKLFNRIFEGERMAEERRSVLIPLKIKMDKSDQTTRA